MEAFFISIPIKLLSSKHFFTFAKNHSIYGFIIFNSSYAY
ncbi:hypothetical protein SPPR111872_10230 [Sphingobacterium prati]